MGAAVLQRDDVVDFLRGRVPADREAVLAQGVGGDVGGADSAPAGTVAPVDLRVTLPLAVALVLRLGVGFAEAGVGEVRAAGLGTRTGRLDWHHALITTAVSVRTGQGRAIVQDITLAVGPEETLVVVGESGAGKSMLAKALTGLLPREFTATGTVRIGTTQLDLSAGTHQFARLRGHEIVWLPQDPFTSFSPTHRLSKQILAQQPHRRRDANAAAIDHLGEVGLPHWAARAYPHQLSGGMLQRAAIAAALDPKPSILIADEPTTALDVTTQREILDLLNTLCHAHGMALILITHDLGIARDYGDDVVVMKEGSIVEAGPVSEVLSSPKSVYTRELLVSEPSVVGPSPRPIPRAKKEIAPIRLSVSDAVKEFGHVRALDHVSLELRHGEAVGVVGESGSGKSTLARAIVGLESLDSGSVDLQLPPQPGRFAKPSSRAAWTQHQRRAVQIVFQNPYSALNPAISVGNTIREALVASGLDPEGVSTLLDQVGLPRAYSQRYPAHLSGGERQRVAIARALAPNPNILICDEAVSALDVSVQDQILTLLSGLQRELDLTLLFITHDLAAVRQVTDRLVVMKHGQIVDSGSTESLLTAPSHPYTSSLLAAVPGSRVSV